MIAKSKIANFYRSKGMPLPRIKQLKPRGITDQDMEAAAVMIYREIQNGIQVDDNDLLRTIRRRALFTSSTKKYRKEILEELIDNYREEVALHQPAYVLGKARSHHQDQISMVQSEGIVGQGNFGKQFHGTALFYSYKQYKENAANHSDQHPRHNFSWN